MRNRPRRRVVFGVGRNPRSTKRSLGSSELFLEEVIQVSSVEVPTQSATEPEAPASQAAHRFSLHLMPVNLEAPKVSVFAADTLRAKLAAPPVVASEEPTPEE